VSKELIDKTVLECEYCGEEINHEQMLRNKGLCEDCIQLENVDIMTNAV
jgi:formylmethanofuran dehydrogenase subunit E